MINCVLEGIASYRTVHTQIHPIAAEGGVREGVSQRKLLCGGHYAIFGSAKTDPVQFKWGFGEGLLKDKFALIEAYKSPISKRRKLLAKRPFFISKKDPV